MSDAYDRACREANHTRYRAGQRQGHYESFFLRANHPTRPLAFWIRYTIFAPHRRPDDAVGEVWAVYFDGETGNHTAVKREVPFAECSFATDSFAVRIEDAELSPGKLAGEAATGAHTIAWELTYHGDAQPLFLLPLRLYGRRLPRAKSLVGLPLASFDGFLSVDGEAVDIVDWLGSQNHNWGSQHTDHYAWGQVAGFDTHPDSFLELGTARLRVGPLWTPFMTPIVLRHAGEEFAINALRQTLRADASFRYFDWSFSSASDGVTIEGNIRAPRDAFVGLAYANPPGGTKHCLNSKLADCDLTITRGAGGSRERLTATRRAAFEILTDDREHGVPIQA